MTIKNKPAFARPLSSSSYAAPEQDGLTYRQWLIGMALQGILAHPTTPGDTPLIALASIEAADAVIAALDREKP
jgi:hypothetical protein